AMPPKRRKRWTEMEIEPEVEQAYERLIDSLLALEFDRDGDGELAPYALRLSPEARAAWISFYDDWARQQMAVEGEIAAAYSKLEAYAARLALIHHVVTLVGLDVSDLRPIGLRSVEAGVKLCQWFANEASRIYTTLSESAQERDMRRLVEFILARGGAIT